VFLGALSLINSIAELAKASSCLVVVTRTASQHTRWVTKTRERAAGREAPLPLEARPEMRALAISSDPREKLAPFSDLARLIIIKYVLISI